MDTKRDPDTPGRERNGCRVDDRLLGDAAAPVSLSHPIHQHRGVYWSGPRVVTGESGIVLCGGMELRLLLELFTR